MWQCLCGIENADHVMNCMECHYHRDDVQRVRGEEEGRRSINLTPVAGSSYIPLKFTGKSGEYFKIWVVNIFLSILTLGLYSPWAKVRKKRYFYGNTFLQEVPFDYLADPIKILKGRLIVFGALVVLLVTVYFLPYLGLILVIPAIALFPWLVVKALSFRARNSSYRNIRFDFSGTYGQAIRVFIGQPIITVLTLGLGYPYQPYRRNKFLINNSAYGTTPFTFAGRVGSFYRIYCWQALGLSILVGIGTFQIPVDSFNETSGGGRMVITTSNRDDSSPSTTNQRQNDEVYETP